MLIFEKNNKLNINFDPSKSIEGTPDIQVGENEISVDGNNIVNSGGSGGANVLTLYADYSVDQPTLDGLELWLNEEKTTQFASYNEAKLLVMAQIL